MSLGLALGRLHRLAGAALGVGAQLLGLQAELLRTVLDLRETLLGLGLTRGQVALGLLAALGPGSSRSPRRPGRPWRASPRRARPPPRAWTARPSAPRCAARSPRPWPSRRSGRPRPRPWPCAPAANDSASLRTCWAADSASSRCCSAARRASSRRSWPPRRGGGSSRRCAQAGVRRLRVVHLGLGVLRLEVEFLDALFQSSDSSKSAVTVGDELGDSFVHLSAVVPTPHKLEAVGEVSLMGFLSNETGEVIGGILGGQAACHRADARLIWRMTPL